MLSVPPITKNGKAQKHIKHLTTHVHKINSVIKVMFHYKLLKTKLEQC